MLLLFYFFFNFFIKAYVVDAIQMSTYNICLYKEVDRKYTGCNLKTTELLDCALIGVCAVIRSNTVCSFVEIDRGIISMVTISMVTLLLPLIQKGKLYWLTAKRTKPAQEKCMVNRLTDQLSMTVTVLTGQ